MASSKEYMYFIKEQLSNLDDIVIKPMMGEYLLYYKNILVGGIYDDRLLVKKGKDNVKYDMEEDIPYPNAKAMYLVSNVDNIDLLEEIIISTYNEIKK